MSVVRLPGASTPTRSAFTGFRFPPEVIVLAVRWYLRFGLSYRDLEELLADRGIEVDHVGLSALRGRGAGLGRRSSGGPLQIAVAKSRNATGSRRRCRCCSAAIS
jgi:hypothetical protein